MQDNIVKIKFNKIDQSDSIEQYLLKRFKKVSRLENIIDSVVCHIGKNSVKGDEKFYITVEVNSKPSNFVLTDSGNDVYKMIDNLADTFDTKISQLHEKSVEYKN